MQSKIKTILLTILMFSLLEFIVYSIWEMDLAVREVLQNRKFQIYQAH